MANIDSLKFNGTIYNIDTSASSKVLVVSATVSSLPVTLNNAEITSDMVVVNSIIGEPSSQSTDLSVTTSDGSLTISGSISASTTITLYLLKSRTAS